MAGIEFYTLTRRGTFEIKPENFTDNQCKGKGWEKYYYQIIIITDTHLDKDDFIIDHQRIDDMVQSLSIKGSCEDIHALICTGLKDILTIHGVNLYACKSIISPEEEISSWIAPITRSWVADTTSLMMLATL